MPSIFISTAHKNQDDEQAGTGDVDYARTLAEKLKELYQSTYGSDEVDCIQHLHDENAIYRHVIEKTKSKNPILHIMLNPPCTGSAFTVEGLVKFKEQSNCKIVVTSIEFAKYNWSLKTQAFSYFKIADHVIFLDDNDKEKAEEFSTLSGVCNTSVIPVPATIPEIPGLKPSEERGNNILFFGMIRKAKGIGYLLNLAQLIKTAQEDTSITIPDSMRDIKIIIVGSIQEHIYDNIFQLTRIMLAMYPEKKEQIEQLINKGGRRLLPEMIKTIIQRLKIELKSYEEQNLPKALPIELYLDVPKDQLAVPFNKCKFSVLPLWRGGSIRNSSMTNMLTHDFITISFSGSATPEILIHGEYSGAMVLLPQTNTSGENVFAENVFDALNARLGDPELNNPTYEKMRYLSNNVLSMTIIIQKHMDLYSSLRVNALQNMPRFVDERFSQDEIELYKKVYAEGKAYQFIKTIRFSDIYDFWGDFVVSMLETKYLGRNWEQKLIRKPLRDEKLPGRHYKANKDGITVSMAGALTEGKEYQPQYTAVEKAGFSKKTSMSVISLEQEYFPPVFGWNKERCEVLGGIMFFPEHLEEHLEEATKTSDANNLLVSIIMQYDGGTVSRSFYFNNILEAEQYLKTKQQEGVWHTDIHSLIAAGKAKSDQKINEVLVRVKWVPKNPKCQLVICSDNLLTRLAMQFRAVDLKVNTGEAFIPISFYIQNREKPNPKVFPYFSTQQQEDLEEALKSTDETLKTLAIMVSWYNNYVQSIESKVPTTQEQELVLSAKCLSLLFCKKLTGLTKIFFLENMFKITLSDSEKLKIEKHDYNEPMLVKLFCEQKKLNKDQLAKFCKEVLQAIVEINFGYNGILDILEKILKINSCLVKEYSLIEEYSLTELLLDSLQKTKSTFCQPKEIEGIIYRLKKYPGELSKDPLLQLDPIIDFFQEKLITLITGEYGDYLKDAKLYDELEKKLICLSNTLYAGIVLENHLELLCNRCSYFFFEELGTLLTYIPIGCCVTDTLTKILAIALSNPTLVSNLNTRTLISDLEKILRHYPLLPDNSRTEALNTILSKLKDSLDESKYITCSFSDLEKMLECVQDSSREEILGKLLDIVKEITVKDVISLSKLLKLLPLEIHINSLIKILSKLRNPCESVNVKIDDIWKQTTVMQYFFESISQDLRFDLLQRMLKQDNFNKQIYNVDNITYLLNVVPLELRAEFLLNNFLGSLVDSIKSFGSAVSCKIKEVLAVLPENQRYNFLNAFCSEFFKVHDAAHKYSYYDVVNMLELLPQEQYIKFLQYILPSDSLTVACVYDTHIMEILKLLPQDQRLKFLRDILPYDLLTKNISYFSTIIKMLNLLPDNERYEFLNIFDIKSLFNSPDQQGERIFSFDILNILKLLLQEQRLNFLHIFPWDIMLSEKFNGYLITKILDVLLENERYEFLNILRVNSLIDPDISSGDILSILKLLPQEQRLNFLHIFPWDIMLSEKFNGYLITKILDVLLENERHEFLNILCINSLIDPDITSSDILKISKLLPQDQSLSFLQKFLSQNLSHELLNDSYDYSKMLGVVNLPPETTSEQFLKDFTKEDDHKELSPRFSSCSLR